MPAKLDRQSLHLEAVQSGKFNLVPKVMRHLGLIILMEMTEVGNDQSWTCLQYRLLVEKTCENYISNTFCVENPVQNDCKTAAIFQEC